MPVHIKGGGGAGFPQGWKENFKGIVHEQAIAKGDPVVCGIYSDIGGGMDIREIPELGELSTFNSVQVSQDGKMFIVCNNGVSTSNDPNNFLYVWNDSTQEFEAHEFPITYGNVTGAGFSSDGIHFAVVENSNGLVDVFSFVNGVITLIDSLSNFSYTSSSIMAMILFFDCVVDDNIRHFIVNSGSGTTVECNAYELNISAGTVSEVQSAIPSGTRRLVKLTENSYVPLSSSTAYSGYIISYSAGTWTKGALIYSTQFKLAVSDDLMYCCEQRPTSPYIYLLKDELGTNTWTKLANPDVLPAGSVWCASFSPGATYLAIGFTVAPFLVIYKRTGDTFAKIANPTVMPTDSVTDIKFTEDGKFLFAIQEGDTLPAKALFCYGLEAGNVVSKVNDFNATPFNWFPSNRKKIGVALDSGEIGSEVRVNLFPALNNL